MIDAETLRRRDKRGEYNSNVFSALLLCLRVSASNDFAVRHELS
jgi:hypothetical protein